MSPNLLARLVGVLVVLRLAMLGTFFVDPGDTRFTVGGPGDFAIRHSCATAYANAAELSGQPGNLYNPVRYSTQRLGAPVRKTRVHREVGRTFTYDAYLYPPPFLLLPRTLWAMSPTFLAFRGAWFLLTTLTLGLAMVATRRWADPHGHNPWLSAAPLLLLAPSAAAALQLGNAQLLVVALAVLGMLALEQRQRSLGAALLGFAIVTKLWPGVLLVWLAARGRWRDVGAVTAAITAWTLIALLAFGPDPFSDFLTFQLPRLLDGSGFPFADVGYISDLAITSWPHKLAALTDQSFAGPRVSGWLVGGWTLATLTAAGWSGSRAPAGGAATVATWLALLTLASLRSPLLPWAYGGFVGMWTLAVLAAVVRGPAKGILGVGAIVLAIHPPLNLGPDPQLARILHAMAGTTVMVAAAALALWVAGARGLDAHETGQ